MRSRIGLLFLAALILSGQDAPIFRAGSRLVQVDVVAREKNAPATGLTKEDFTLLDNGKARQIALFSVTEASGSRAPSAPVPAGAVSNRVNRSGVAPATATVLLIDRLNTPVNSQPYANRKVMEFLQAHGNSDRLGIYTLGNSVRVLQDLTDDPDRLNRAIHNLKPQDVRHMSPEAALGGGTDAVTDQMVARGLTELQDFIVRDKVQTTREALEAIARHLAKVPGRKNLIWVSGSFPLFIKRAHYNIDFSQDVDEAARVLNDANIAVYAVDARGLMGMTANTADQGSTADSVRNCATAKGPCILPGPQSNLPSGLDTMNFLSGLTGGRAFYNTNGIDDSIRAAIGDSEITYTLGFYPPPDALDDKFHKLAVKVARKGVEVRLRNGYLASQAGAQAAPATMQQLLSDSLDATAVGLTVEAQRAAAGQYEMSATIDLHDIHLEKNRTKWRGSVDFAFVVEGTQAGKAVTENIEIPEGELAHALESGMVVTDSVQAPARASQLRVAVQDRSTGAAGSVRMALGR